MDTAPLKASNRIMARFTHIQLETVDALTRIQLARPDARNALSSDLLKELSDALSHTHENKSTRVVEISGAGVDFCAGFDLHHMSARVFSEGLDEALVRDLAEAGRTVIAQILALPSITVGVVQGHALGGGFLIAASCDLRVVSEDAHIALPEVDLGMPLIWGGIPLLLREFGPATVRDLVFTGRALDGSGTAFEGFASRTAPSNALSEESERLVGTLLAKPEQALSLLKQQCIQEMRKGVATREDEEQIALDAILHPDFLATVMRAIQR